MENTSISQSGATEDVLRRVTSMSRSGATEDVLRRVTSMSRSGATEDVLRRVTEGSEYLLTNPPREERRGPETAPGTGSDWLQLAAGALLQRRLTTAVCGAERSEAGLGRTRRGPAAELMD
ncbi:hypothetical protein LEMLEM_LOCUS9996 [Lemmus lemmus]